MQSASFFCSEQTGIGAPVEELPPLESVVEPEVVGTPVVEVVGSEVDVEPAAVVEASVAVADVVIILSSPHAATSRAQSGKR